MNANRRQYIENDIMNNYQDKQIAERIGELRVKRKEILSMTPEKALDTILDYPQTAALVHSFADEDFYFLIHDIGLDDSIELLSLASEQQWEYIMDIEAWDKDRVSLDSVTKWLDLLLKADPNRLIRWFLQEKTEFVEYYLFKNIEVLIREHDQDPSDFPDDFFTFDDIFYVRFRNDVYESELKNKDQRDQFLSDFLERLADYDHVTYQSVLFETSSITPSESEEENYRLRNVRLAEKGFMPFDEAVAVYQPLKIKDLGKQVKKFPAKSDSADTFLPVPFYPTGMLKEDNLFTRSLSVIETDEILQQMQAEFAALCNQVIAADEKAIREREELRHIVKKVCGYLSIGLERLTEEQGLRDTLNRTAALIQQYPLSQIFRVGYCSALELKWRAEKWQKSSWSAQEKLPLIFWGEEGMGLIGGLLIKKPMYFDNYKTGVIYREFTCVKDIRETETALAEIISIDRLFSLMTISAGTISGLFLTYKNFLLTLWMRHSLGLTEELLPVNLEEFSRFFASLWSGESKPRKIKLSVKESFLNWFSEKTGKDAYEITQSIGQMLERLFDEIESEYGEVSVRHLDPKHIYLFLVK
jgi:hypothetical protein